MIKNRIILTLLLMILAASTTLAGDVIRICGQNVQNFFYSLDRERTQGNYYIKDYYGRYVYQYYNTSSGKYGNNTNVGVKSAAQPFTVIPQEDGTFKILNTVSNCYYIALTYQNKPEFALYNYTSLYSGQHLPWLYRYDATANPTGISTVESCLQPAAPRKVVENGCLFIVMPNGQRYNLQGMGIKYK